MPGVHNVHKWPLLARGTQPLTKHGQAEQR